MTFFYDLNKRLAALANKQDAQQLAEEAKAVAPESKLAQALNERDMGKHNNATTGFAALAKKAGGGNIKKGNRIAGAQLAKMRAKGQVEESDMDESALQAYIGDKKYGKAGMDALRKAGREGASKDKMNQIRNRYNKMDEADMEEGNKFTGNLMKARAAGLKKADLDGDGDMETVREADLVGLGEKKAKPDYIDLDKDGNRKETMKKAAADKKKSRGAGTAFDPEVAKSMFANKDDHPRYDVKDTGYSKRYTRKEDPKANDDEEVSDQPKKKGRPKGPAKGPERVTAKSYKYKAGRPSKAMEGNMDPADSGEYDREGDMAKEQMHTIMSAAKELHRILRDDENLPEWVQKKITLAKEYIDTARDYMLTQHAERAEEQPIAEKAVSVVQRRAAGIAHAAQKGEIPKKELRGASKEMAQMPKGELKKFAKTKETGLPEKAKKEESVEETSNTPKQKKSSGGYDFGGSIYESINSKVESMITEGMSVNISVDEQGKKSISVNATDQDAEALATLLKMAGMNSQRETCSSCGQADCGCAEMVDENSPDWPTNTETSDNALQYSGGLNGPKSTGQTTVPVVASQQDRLRTMEEGVKIERSLFDLYTSFKNK
jgi:hypothetical protein